MYISGKSEKCFEIPPCGKIIFITEFVISGTFIKKGTIVSLTEEFQKYFFQTTFHYHFLPNIVFLDTNSILRVKGCIHWCFGQFYDKRIENLQIAQLLALGFFLSVSLVRELRKKFKTQNSNLKQPSRSQKLSNLQIFNSFVIKLTKASILPNCLVQ